MNFLEKDLEDIIWDNIKSEKLKEKGLDFFQQFVTRCYRQFCIGNYGITDIVTVSRPVWFEHRHVLDLAIKTYEYDVDGISFTYSNDDFELIDEGFYDIKPKPVKTNYENPFEI